MNCQWGACNWNQNSPLSYSKNMQYFELVMVMFYLTIAAVATEVILWVWHYRRPSFRQINEQIEKASRKMDAMKATGAKKSAKQKNLADRMEKGLKREAYKEMALFKFKQSLVVRLRLTAC